MTTREDAQCGRRRRAAACLLALWPLTQWLTSVPGLTGDDTAGAIAELSGHPALSVMHFAISDGVAPVLLWFLLSPAVRLIDSRDSRFAVAFSGASASVMALIQMAIGIWMALVPHPTQVASFAGAETVNDLSGAQSILIAGIAVHLLTSRLRSARTSVLLITSAATAGLSGISRLAEIPAPSGLDGASELLFALAVASFAWTAPPPHPSLGRSAPMDRLALRGPLDDLFTVPQDPLSERHPH